jgi:site-specific recombinase XerD
MTLSVSSQSAYLRPLDQFGDWLAWEGWVAANPFTQTYDSLLPKIKGTTRVLKSATADDVRALLDATRGGDPLSQRDHALLLTG